MKLIKFIILDGIMVALLLAGCASPPERVLSQKAPAYATLPNGHDPLNPDQVSHLYATLTLGSGEAVIRNRERKRGHPLNLLSLSGGGQNGAFSAGFLAGWRESGQRPEFDIVGGVSTGALLATHALLGTPADDASLEEMYTQITKKNIYRDRNIFSLAFGADSLSDTTPLRALIAKHITAETLERVAAAYDDNRLLLVGTTNVDYSQTWIWNMTLIAKDGNLKLYREVLLASASFPIVFPPVEIDGHLFIDGAARSNVVIPGMGLTERPKPPLYGPGNVYLIANGRLKNPPEALRRAIGDVAATTVSVMMDQSMLTALTRSYVGAQLLGYNFKIVAIPDSVNVGKDPLAFDPKQMRAAFDAGRALGKQPDPWSTVPPNLGDIPTWALEAIKERRY
ncbi:patatin-like phospholipase family protein [Nitrosomonas communis]|uniref:patatin-like phospholipase family protein n=1 Tax=Nitrosomonas communis TaxID=44574 RepID=UPI003D281E64